MWSEIGRVGLLCLVGNDESGHDFHDVEHYYDCKPENTMLDAYTEV